MKRGFLYVAYGDSFIHEAAGSSKIAQNIHNIPTALITDQQPSADIASAFNHVILHKLDYGYQDKILMHLSPFEETIFLDTDTIILSSIASLFDLLRKFDMAIQYTPGGHHYSLPDVPYCFYEPSAGIIAWRKSSQMDAFFALWANLYREVESTERAIGAWDQRSLRWALWKSTITFGVIPTEYQFCTYKPEVVHGRIHMIHGRNVSPSLLRAANCNDSVRVYYPKVGIVPIYYSASIAQLFRHWLSFLGMIIRQIARRFFHWSGVWTLPKKRRLD